MKKFVKDNKVTLYNLPKSAEELQELRKHKAKVIPDKKKESAKKKCRGNHHHFA